MPRQPGSRCSTWGGSCRSAKQTVLVSWKLCCVMPSPGIGLAPSVIQKSRVQVGEDRETFAGENHRHGQLNKHFYLGLTKHQISDIVQEPHVRNATNRSVPRKNRWLVETMDCRLLLAKAGNKAQKVNAEGTPETRAYNRHEEAVQNCPKQRSGCGCDHSSI